MDTHLHAVAMLVSLGLEHQHHKGCWAPSSASAVETGLRSFGSLVRRVRAPFPEPSVYFLADHVIRRRGTRLWREIRCCRWSRAGISRSPLLVVDTHTARRV